MPIAYFWRLRLRQFSAITISRNRTVLKVGRDTEHVPLVASIEDSSLD